MTQYDYVIVGGGLAGGLIALTVLHATPRAKVIVVERSDRPAGNHTWSFHASDLPADAESVVRPLIEFEWPAYHVQFAAYSRDVRSTYACITSTRMAAAIKDCGCELRTNVEAITLTEHRVTLTTGEVLEGQCVIDARGPEAGTQLRQAGYQKFVGLEVETVEPWPTKLPTVMDATVQQHDGYRFVYVLPFTPHRVLVEDTYFSDDPQLNRPQLRGRIAEYLAAKGIREWRLLREESGVLPMPWAGGEVHVRPGQPLAAGYTGGWFHPATGYSFPTAIRLALALASVSPDNAHQAALLLAQQIAPRQRFARFLNRLLFTAVIPQERWQVFRRIYRTLPESTLARFYAQTFGMVDAARLVLGWPPPIDIRRLIHRRKVPLCQSLG